MNLSDIPKLVINLPERGDRLAQFNEELKHIGTPEVTIIPGVTDVVPMRGIAQAHMAAIRHARDLGMGMALIMEDDVVFQGRGKTLPYLTEALNNTPDNWDVLLGGLYEATRIQKVNGYWSRVGEFCALHFYIIKASAYDTAIEGYDNATHFDRWVNKGGHKLNVFVTNKFISTQRTGFSDNVKKIVDYSDRVKRFDLL